MPIRPPFRLLSLLAVSTFASTLLTGCGMGHITTTQPSTAFQGKVFGGQQPVGQSSITVWGAGTASYGEADYLLAHVTSDDNGNFSIPAGTYTCPTPTTQVYITAAGGYANPSYPNPNILLAAGLGNCASAQNQFVIINEVTTAATAYAMAHFYDETFSGGGFGSSLGDAGYLALSDNNTIPMLVDLPTGTALPSGNGVTREPELLNTIANILAACVNDSSDFNRCTQLFNDTPNTGSPILTPTDTLSAAVTIALQPTQNVTDLFGLPSGTPPFTGLATQPNDFTLAVAYTSPNFGLSINSAYPGGSSSSIDIATDGRVFFPSNAPGKIGVGVFDPSTGTFDTLKLSGLLTLPQYVAADPNNNIFESDLGSGKSAFITSDYATTFSGAIDVNSTSSAAVSSVAVNDGFFSETTSSGTTNLTANFPGIFTHIIAPLTAPATGIAVDSDGNIFSMTSGAATPCSIEHAVYDSISDSYIDTINVQTSSNCRSGGIFSLYNPLSSTSAALGVATTLNQACGSNTTCTGDPFLSAPQAIAIDGGHAVWLANSGNASLSYSGLLGNFNFTHPDTLFNPYGLAVDGSGNVWLSNAGCVTTTMTPCTPGPFTLTEFIGAGAPTYTPVGNNNYSLYAGTEPQANRHNSATLAKPTNIHTPWLH